VPQPRVLSQSDVLERIEACYGHQYGKELREQIERNAKETNGIDLSERLLESYRRRMNDLSIFIKELKGGFAQWYNRRHRRYGVLWAERFKSLLLEGGRAVATVAAYIDLNPIRAALCADPKDYRYCGYAEAVATGSEPALAGIRTILDLSETTSWKDLLSEYRKQLFGRGRRPAVITDPRLSWTRRGRSLRSRMANSQFRSNCVAEFAISAMESFWEAVLLLKIISTGLKKRSATDAKAVRPPSRCSVR